MTSLTEESSVPTPDVNGNLRWYFPNCGPDGVLHDRNPKEELLDMYQIINIIPGNSQTKYIRETYCDDPEAIVSMHQTYQLDCKGNVHDVILKDIEYVAEKYEEL